MNINIKAIFMLCSQSIMTRSKFFRISSTLHKVSTICKIDESQQDEYVEVLCQRRLITTAFLVYKLGEEVRIAGSTCMIIIEISYNE